MKNLEDLRTLKEKCVAQVAEAVQGMGGYGYLRYCCRR